MGKIQEHWKTHKNKYLIGGAIIASAGTGVLVGLAVNNKLLTKNQIVQGFAWNSPPTINVHIEALGDPGNIIQDLTTGTIYASQGQTARELGVNPARISEHLAGKIPNVNGHVLTKLGKASVAE